MNRGARVRAALGIEAAQPLVVVSRQSAIDLGLSRYYTGVPCKNGHISERKVHRHVCVQCKRESVRRRHSGKKTVSFIGKSFLGSPKREGGIHLHKSTNGGYVSQFTRHGIRFKFSLWTANKEIAEKRALLVFGLIQHHASYNTAKMLREIQRDTEKVLDLIVSYDVLISVRNVLGSSTTKEILCLDQAKMRIGMLVAKINKMAK